MPELNLDKLDKFTNAHEARREALSRHSPAMFERVAGMYEHLGCPLNAAAIRAQASYERVPKYVLRSE
jgi:hypothetical protein